MIEIVYSSDARGGRVPRNLPPILGEAAPFLALLEEVSRVAPLERPALVIGERGTGKELIASRLHYLSGRWGEPMVEVNCAALPESLLETELFGHEAGAFTGATRARIGRFEQADGGTLFLDEIANASLRTQEQVLRVIEYGAFSRVGSGDTRRVDVRVLGATNVDLPSEARAGRFRPDLLDRLAFDVITVPPLRARGEDVMLLAENFGRGIAREIGWPAFPGFSATARRALEAYRWPGNVRELKNVVERSVYRAEPHAPVDEILLDPFDSPYRPAAAVEAAVAAGFGAPAADRAGVASVRPPADGPRSPAPPSDVDTPFDYRERVAAYSRLLLERALEDCRFNQRATAERVGLGYHQLRRELKKHALVD